MIGPIFAATLRNNWRQMLYWGAGLGALGLFVLLAIPAEALKGYAELLGNLPPAISQLISVSDAALLSTPDGFLSVGFFSFALLILAVFAVSAGLNVTANEEEEGILDVVLSWPLPRWQIVLGRFLAWAVMGLVIVGLAFIGLLIGRALGEMAIDIGRALENCLNMIPSLLLMITLTMLVAATVRRKWTAVMIAGGFVVVSYFLDYLGEAFANDFARLMRRFSFFAYYDSAEVMQNGLNIGNVVLLCTVAGVLLVGALWSFQRRDVGL